MATTTLGGVPTPNVDSVPNLNVTQSHNYGTRYRSGSLPSKPANNDREVSFRIPQERIPQTEKKKKRRKNKNKRKEHSQSFESPNSSIHGTSNGTLQHSITGSDSVHHNTLNSNSRHSNPNSTVQHNNTTNDEGHHSSLNNSSLNISGSALQHSTPISEATNLSRASNRSLPNRSITSAPR